MIRIGKIVNTQGLNGEVRVLSNSDFKDVRFVVGNKLFIDYKGEKISVEIERHYVKKTFDIIKFKEFNKIEEVEKFKNKFLLGEELKQEDLEDGQYLNSTLVGLNVFNQEDKKIGKVIEIVESPRYNLLRVKHEDSSVLVPFIDEFILDVNLESEKVIINEIEGLI